MAPKFVLAATLGFDWHPDSGVLYGMDHGIDWMGDTEPPEELNRLRQGAHYGWPYVYGNRHNVPQTGAPEGSDWKDFAARTEAPVLTYTTHAAPMQMTFYTGSQFPAEYRHDAFIAMRGSWNRVPPAGYEVVRIRFNDAGEPEAMAPFPTGFLMQGEDGEYRHFVRLAGLAMAADGALLVSDDTNGVIYRISHEAGEG